ncbi:N-acetylmuramoyl-L-alanine amidase [Halomonas organivorans]|uniref:N-acetylmuramoyl-L-alanine amidase n=1 Tax=Halomonas organivorans TaxID=257772 RepID=A0A7W5BVQ7_9GAMM|nr:N-acetylmuramoyl-L-alanine amidase [Halomonas organivorans]MBB3139981.1 N-acetylmuramoyl-L-alanine amidase [Halomonas organivorans]
MRRRPSLTLAILATLLLGGCASVERPAGDAGYAIDDAHASGAHSSRVRYLVLHYTDEDEATSLEILTGPHVSAHYLIPRHPDRDLGAPRVYRLVDESRRAWHAGASAWAGRRHLNDTSLGIELVNAGPDHLPDASAGDGPVTWASFPDAQIDALIALLEDVIARHDIAPTDVLGHAEIAPTRKIDPGPAFPWQRLYAAGIGTWPAPADVVRFRRAFAAGPPTLAVLQRALAAWGYAVTPSGELDSATQGALRAFQMRYRPNDYRGQPDADTAARLWALLARYRPEALSDPALAWPASTPGATPAPRG